MSTLSLVYIYTVLLTVYYADNYAVLTPLGYTEAGGSKAHPNCASSQVTTYNADYVNKSDATR